MENRVLSTELVNWRELNDLQPKGFKINRNFEALKASLKKYGFSLPFLAYKDTKNKVWVLDGHTRKEALEALILEGEDVPNELPCTFISAKNKTEAGKLLLEVYNQKQNPIDGLFFDVFIEELEIDIEELDVEAINIEEVVVGNSNYNELDDDFFNTKKHSSSSNYDNNNTPKEDTITEDTGVLDNKRNLGSDDNYTNFELVMLYTNKVHLMQTINSIKDRFSIEKIEDAIMELVNFYNQNI